VSIQTADPSLATAPTRPNDLPTPAEVKVVGASLDVAAAARSAVAGPAALCIVTTAAILLHRFLPNLQSPEPTRLYPLFLQGVLCAGVGSIVLQAAIAPTRSWIRHHTPLVAAGIVLLCLWDLITLKLDLLPLPYFPGPDLVIQSLVQDWWELLDSALRSLLLLMVGYAAGCVLGLVCGVLIGWSPQFRYWGMPALKLAGPIPATALVPLAMILFPTAFLSGTALIAAAVWFPVTMLTASGIANVRVSYLDVARTLGAGRAYLVFRVAIPAALPSIFIGFFMGLGASFLTLIVAETVGAKAGLGWYIDWAKIWADYAKVYAALAIMAVFFSAIMTALFKVRDRVLVWQKGVIKW